MGVEENRGRALRPRGHGYLIIVLSILILVAASLYVVFKANTFFSDEYSITDKFFGVILLLAEIFVFIHVLGYLISILKSTAKYNIVSETYFADYLRPKVSCFICSYNEPKEVLEETIASVVSLAYNQKEVILLDDSTGEFRKEARELGKKYSIRVIQRNTRKGFKAGALNNGLKKTDSKYFVVFDADQKPISNFLNDLIFLMEKNPKLAFIQTPQYYANTKNLVAEAAWNRQSVFYEYISEGKSSNNAMFCCGSNFIARKDAILSVGGFDESTVTEDFATTFKLHKKKWDTLYYNVVYVVGIGPETIEAYLKQQYRWAHGTISTFKQVVASFFTNPFLLKIGQWWEYLLSSTYFFTGWSNFIFMIMPVAFLLFGIRPLIIDPLAYVSLFVPYFVLTMMLFAYSMRRRGHDLRDLLIGQSISMMAFNTYMAASISALSGIKIKFSTTPKGKQRDTSILFLWPQLGICLLSLLAGVIGIVKWVSNYDLAILVNVFWAFYHAILLSFFVISSMNTEK